MPKWDAETDAKLLAAIMKTSDFKFDLKAIATLMSTDDDVCTPKAVTHRIGKIKADCKKYWPEDDSAPAAVVAHPATPKTPAPRKRKPAKTPDAQDDDNVAPPSTTKKRKTTTAIKKEATPESDEEGTKEEGIKSDSDADNEAPAAAALDTIKHKAPTPFSTPAPVTPGSDVVMTEDGEDVQTPATPSAVAGGKKATTAGAAKKGRAKKVTAAPPASGDGEVGDAEPATPAKKTPAVRKPRGKAATPKATAATTPRAGAGEEGADDEDAATVAPAAKKTPAKKGKTAAGASTATGTATATSKPRGRAPKATAKAATALKAVERDEVEVDEDAGATTVVDDGEVEKEGADDGEKVGKEVDMRDIEEKVEPEPEAEVVESGAGVGEKA